MSDNSNKLPAEISLSSAGNRKEFSEQLLPKYTTPCQSTKTTGTEKKAVEMYHYRSLSPAIEELLYT